MASDRNSTEALKRFEHDVREHELRVVRADGVNRHLAFRRPSTSNYWFEILTWPGALCIRGDMGCYVFSRIEDMFEFFRGEPGRINSGYWAEKLVASSRNGEIEEFSWESFRRAVIYDFRERWRGFDEWQPKTWWAARRECFKAVRNEVLFETDDPNHAVRLAMEFYWRSDDRQHEFGFQDFYEHNLKEYSFHFLWCLYAIVWAIKQFDKASTVAEVPHD